MKILEMEDASLASLRTVAEELNIPNAHRMKKEISSSISAERKLRKKALKSAEECLRSPLRV